jgi:hypothetical protein
MSYTFNEALAQFRRFGVQPAPPDCAPQLEEWFSPELLADRQRHIDAGNPASTWAPPLDGFQPLGVMSEDFDTAGQGTLGGNWETREYWNVTFTPNIPRDIPNIPRDIVDEIDALVEESMAGGEPEVGYTYDDPQYPRCWHCGRHWHGLPITEKIAQMYSNGRYDEEYVAAEDDTRVLCQGSDFIGPMPTEHPEITTFDGVWSGTYSDAIVQLPLTATYFQVPITRYGSVSIPMQRAGTICLFSVGAERIAVEFLEHNAVRVRRSTIQ